VADFQADWSRAVPSAVSHRGHDWGRERFGGGEQFAFADDFGCRQWVAARDSALGG
jgi:hypothetical protein